jgi:phosphoglycerate dehydrogenase-like enzyme
MDDPRAELVYTPSVRSRIAETFELLPAATANTDVEVLFTGWGGPILDSNRLAGMPSLRACFHAAGTVRPMIVTDEFWRRDIVLSSAYHANAEPVAEFCHSLIILLLKGAFPAQQDGGFSPPGIYGATIGLVSYGTIARLLRAKLHALRARVLVYDPFLSAAEAEAQGVELMELPGLLESAQIVSLHTPLLPETRHLLDDAQLRHLRRHACLINTARGAIIDTDALVRLLADRPDLFACLDVTEPEPLPTDSPVRKLPNVFLTPHLAGSSGTECERLGEAMAEEAERYLGAVPLKWRIEADAFRRMA